MKNENLTQGNIFIKLFKFAIPILFALFLQAAYGAVDLIVVGNYGSTADLSGVGTGSQFMHSLTMVVSCFAVGATVLIGMRIGEKKEDEANKIIGSAIVFFVIIAIALSILMELIAVPFCIVMQAPKEAFNETVSYVRICCGGFIFIILYNLIGSICRGLGDSITPLITVLISAILNVGLDLLFCAQFNMGTNGAALATIISQGISVVLSLIIIKYRKEKLPFKFNLKFKDLVFDKKINFQIFKIGFPLALQEFLVGASFLIIVAIANNLGLYESAGIGIAEKLCGFIMLVPSAFSQTISAFTAQNVGAGMHDRAKKALISAISISLLIAVALFYFSFFKGELLSSIFTNTKEVQKESSLYLKAYAIDTFLTSFLFCLFGYLNGYQKTSFIMIQGIIGAFGIRVPVSLIMSSLENTNLFLIGLATPCSSFIQIIMCLTCVFIMNKKRKTDQELN